MSVRLKLFELAHVTFETGFCIVRCIFCLNAAPCNILCCACGGWCSAYWACLFGTSASIAGPCIELGGYADKDGPCEYVCRPGRKRFAYVGVNMIGLMCRIVAIAVTCMMLDSARHLNCLKNNEDDFEIYNASAQNNTNATGVRMLSVNYKGVDDDWIDWQKLCKVEHKVVLTTVLWYMVLILAAELVLNLFALCIYNRELDREAADAGNYNADKNYDRVEQNSPIVDGQPIEGFGLGLPTLQSDRPTWMNEDDTATGPRESSASSSTTDASLRDETSDTSPWL